MKKLLIVLALLSLGAPAAMATPSTDRMWTKATSSPENFAKFKVDHDENGWVDIQKLSNIVLLEEYHDRLNGLSPEVVEVLKVEFANEFIRVTGLTSSTYVATDTFYRIGHTQGGIPVPSEARFDAALGKAQAAVAGSTGPARVLTTGTPVTTTSSLTLPPIGEVRQGTPEQIAELRAKWEANEMATREAREAAGKAQTTADSALRISNTNTRDIAQIDNRLSALERTVSNHGATIASITDSANILADTVKTLGPKVDTVTGIVLGTDEQPGVDNRLKAVENSLKGTDGNVGLFEKVQQLFDRSLTMIVVGLFALLLIIWLIFRTGRHSRRIEDLTDYPEPAAAGRNGTQAAAASRTSATT